MKKMAVILILAVLLVACTPSESSIATAIAKTQAAVPTATPLPPTVTLESGAATFEAMVRASATARYMIPCIGQDLQRMPLPQLGEK